MPPSHPIAQSPLTHVMSQVASSRHRNIAPDVTVNWHVAPSRHSTIAPWLTSNLHDASSRQYKEPLFAVPEQVVRSLHAKSASSVPLNVQVVPTLRHTGEQWEQSIRQSDSQLQLSPGAQAIVGKS